MNASGHARERASAADFRRVARHLASGVTIVTSVFEGVPVGMTATAVCSVSTEPPMLLCSLSATSRTALGVAQQNAFAVHLLPQHARHYAEQFSTPGDHFSGIAYRDDEETRVPVLAEVLGFFLCVREHAIEVADHVLFVGRVVECEVDDAHLPLVYFDRSYRNISLGD